MKCRNYIKALGSVCYDQTGMTGKTIKWREMPGIRNPRWGKQFGWSNQPKMLTFDLVDPAAANEWLVAQCPSPGLPCLLIVPHWNNMEEQ
jgi:hypothetical protein